VLPGNVLYVNEETWGKGRGKEEKLIRGKER